MKNTKWYILTWLALSPVLTYAQPSILDEYIRVGLENNQDYLKERLSTAIAQEESNTTRSAFFPDITFHASYLLAEGGRTIDFPAGDLFNPVYASLNQLTETNRFPENLANVNEQLLPNNFQETKLRIVQPILNTDLYYGYKARQSMLSLNEAKEQAYRNQLIFQIKNAYYTHLKLSEQEAILDSTRRVVQELVRVNGKFVQYAVATKEVLYNAEAQLYQLEAQRATVEKNINTSRNFFNFLLNQDLSPISCAAKVWR